MQCQTRLKISLVKNIGSLSGVTFRLAPHYGGLVVSNFDKCRPDIAGDVISGGSVRPIVPDKCAEFRDFRLNRSRKIPSEPIGCGI